MVNFEAIIRHFWTDAVVGAKSDHDRYDLKALEALNKKNDPNRRKTIREWLQAYRVFRVRGIATQKDKIADAVLTWADSTERERELDSPTALYAAHGKVMKAMCEAYICDSQNKQREFTSLASKALWLCYPDKVPMYDSYAQRALWVLAKLDTDVTAPLNESIYHTFVSVWQQFYEKSQETINELDMNGYPYRVRVFDRILWMIGKDQYTVPA